MAGLDPAIHANCLWTCSKARRADHSLRAKGRNSPPMEWMAGSSPAMTRGGMARWRKALPPCAGGLGGGSGADDCDELKSANACRQYFGSTRRCSNWPRARKRTR
jgi:hypothetical protein